MEVVGNMATLPTLDHFQDAPEVRPLPSTIITRFQRYYEPVRHPTRPGLSLAGFRLAARHPPLAFPVLRRFSGCRHAVAITPVATRLGLNLLPWISSRRRPSPSLCWVGCHIACFEACSAFTFVTACLRRVAKRPSTSKAPAVSLPPPLLRLLPAGARRSRVGIAPTEESRLITAHKRDGVNYLDKQRRMG
jgi:hypothetical protein